MTLLLRLQCDEFTTVFIFFLSRINFFLFSFFFPFFPLPSISSCPTWDEKGDKLPHVVLFLLYRWRGTAESSFSILPGPPPQKEEEEEENKYVGFFLFLSPSINVISYQGGLAWVFCVCVCVEKVFSTQTDPTTANLPYRTRKQVYTYYRGWCIYHVKASGSYGYIYLILRAVCSVLGFDRKTYLAIIWFSSCALGNCTCAFHFLPFLKKKRIK